ncbi:ef-1 guanine nucleotide exchange domain-containing protein [Cystoisospora suis]|uniref:Ef-1 guanine nucleotide exchange domain-containing protein n=1 Tax=Cystoisospora suis TaxID=483139 RepID=A0A2C6LCE1_9APIC|nr:ef-1 guanine nucleotide exchange domain-containing protein [Cystoisospora suis]
MAVAFPSYDELLTPCTYYTLTWGDGAVATSKTANDDDDFDLFGEESAEDKEAIKKLAESKKKESSKKNQVINKSMLVIEVKPADADTDLDDICKKVKSIEMEGVKWGEGSKKVPVAFGLYKLQVQCVVLDDVVNTNALVDEIEEIGMTEEQKKRRRQQEEGDEDEGDDEDCGGLVQSAEIVSFNKL